VIEAFFESSCDCGNDWIDLIVNGIVANFNHDLKMVKTMKEIGWPVGPKGGNGVIVTQGGAAVRLPSNLRFALGWERIARWANARFRDDECALWTFTIFLIKRLTFTKLLE
jgi:hypothetical protein